MHSLYSYTDIIDLVGNALDEITFPGDDDYHEMIPLTVVNAI